jgi:hypothetical protein
MQALVLEALGDDRRRRIERRLEKHAAVEERGEVVQEELFVVLEHLREERERLGCEARDERLLSRVLRVEAAERTMPAITDASTGWNSELYMMNKL